MKTSADNQYSNILLVANYKSDVGFAWWLMENFWSEIARSYEGSSESILIYPEVNLIPHVIGSSPIKVLEHDFSLRDIGSILGLVRLIREHRIGFVYLTDKAYYDWFYLLLRLCGVKKIVNHDHLPGERTKISMVKRCLKRFVHLTGFFSCDYYIGVSEFVMRRMTDTACIPEKKCTFIHNGIRLFDSEKSSYARDVFNIPQGSKIVVSTGRATYYKGIDFLIRCAHVLVQEKGLKHLYFLHVGDGPDLADFRKIAADLDVESHFIFAGLRDDVARILPSCDIGIQASLGEAFSLSILEYMCAGLVTLVPNNCGNSEAVTDQVDGLLYNPGDIDEVVDRIMTLLGDADLFSRLGKAARKTVLDKFAIEQCNQNLVSALKTVWG